jgi:drug/metabolite transporter (DMT)-like permease
VAHTNLREGVRKIAAAIFGAIACLVGAYSSMVVQFGILTGTRPLSKLPQLLLFLLVAGCLGALGFLCLRYVYVGRDVTSKVVWWRVVLGVMLIAMQALSHVAPSPDRFLPANAAQASGAVIANVFVIVLGLWLIASGIRPKARQ